MKEQIEKQAIEEIAKVIERTEQIAMDSVGVLPSPTMYAKDLYWKGYRKQIEGEWIRQEKKNGRVSPEAVCSNCGRDVEYQVIDGKWAFENYCSHCGAKMKGGAE